MKTRVGGLAVGLALAICGATTAAADMTMSGMNAPDGGLTSRVAALMGAERDGLARAGTDLRRLTRAPGGTRPAGATRREWLAALPAKTGGQQWGCLSQALYFEARGESVTGEFAVAEVILNRVASARFPDTVCGVVGQGDDRASGCQFSYTCDGLPETIAEAAAYRRAGKIARVMLAGAPRGLTGGATYYHATSVTPAWARAFDRTARIGRHEFYRPPGN